jgi:hypothetical protein
MHNTIVVDGKNQANFDDRLLWDMKRKDAPVLNVWESNEKEDRIDCTHKGYSWLGDQITHNRQIRFDKNAESWEIQDIVTSAGNHIVGAYYHLDPQVQVSLSGKSATLVSNGVKLYMDFEVNNECNIDLEDDKVSKGYGQMTNSKTLIVKADGQNELIIKTKIWVRKN